MSEPRRFMDLAWVKGEIEDRLRSAREALEAFFESPDDTTLVRQCVTNLHQVKGTLQTIELHGAAALATEMEALAQALMNDGVSDSDAALESLKEGILQLASHLDRVHRGGEDDAGVHALLMDRMRVARMRVVRGELPRARREEMVADPEAVAVFLDSPLPAETRKLRANYQRGMVALIREQPPPERIWPFLDRIFTRLEQITPESALQRLWGLAAGVMEIRAADGEPPSAVVPLLRDLDQQLKDLVTSPEATLSATPPPKLREELTAIVNASEQDSERLSRLRQALVPVGAEPVDGAGIDLSAPDQESPQPKPVETPEFAAADPASEAGEDDPDLNPDLEPTAEAAEDEDDLDLNELAAGTAAEPTLPAAHRTPEVDEDDLDFELDEPTAEAAEDEDDLDLDELAAGTVAERTSLAAAWPLEGGEDDLDFAFDEPTTEAAEDEDDLDLDELAVGTAAEPTPPAAVRTPQVDEDALELDEPTAEAAEDEGELDLDKPSAGTAAEPPPAAVDRTQETGDDDLDLDFELDAPMAEAGQNGDDLDLNELAAGTAAEPPPATADPTPEAGENDLDLDFDLDEPTAEAGAKDLDLDELAAATATEPTPLVADGMPEAGEDHIDLDFELDAPMAEAAKDEDDLEPYEPPAEPPPAADPAPDTGSADPYDTGDGADTLSDDDITEIFLEEAGEVLEAMDGALTAWSASADDRAALIEIRQGWHTLKGNGRMMGASVLGELAWSIENMLNRVVDRTIEASPLVIDLVRRTRDLVPELLAAFSEARDPDSDVSPLMERADILASGGGPEDLDDLPGTAPAAASVVGITPAAPALAEWDLPELFEEEAGEHLDQVRDWLRQASSPGAAPPLTDSLRRALHSLQGSAAMVDLSVLSDLAASLERLVRAYLELQRPVDLPLLQTFAAGVRRIEAVLEHLRQAGTEPVFDRAERDYLAEAEALLKRLEQEIHGREDRGGTEGAPIGDIFRPEGMDRRIEADEWFETLVAALESWAGGDDRGAEEMMRALQALDRSARMAGLGGLGREAQELETWVGARRETPDAQFFAELRQRCDAMAERIAALRRGEAIPGHGIPEEPASEKLGAGTQLDASPPPGPSPERMSGLPGDLDQTSRDGLVRESREEMLRISSDLLDDLANLAGETSITRARIQQEISDFSATLEEMDATIERIRDQVRRLERTAEEQVHFGRDAAEQAEADFDPLEMDRYTQLQELTRTLAESTSDVGDLRGTLKDRLGNADTLLRQQARINTELQEGLMRTRMVPFARLLPRLKRIVRQVGRELGKPVELEVENVEGELDRSVLERMISPLEHMLRNAVDQGLETPEARVEQGKPPQGTITLRLSQPSGEILIEVGDDGGGIDVEGVRAKAIERGLLSVDSDPDESEILSLIMSPDFSTAESITQLSGRGVGMDVVNNEVEQLGGSIAVASTLGEGTVFSVRLPSRVSVSRALMVRVGDDSYAIPLAGIEGIVRVPPAQLQHRYESGDARLEYAGRSYELSALAEWLGLPRSIPDDVPSVPVLVVRTGDSA